MTKQKFVAFRLRIFVFGSSFLAFKLWFYWGNIGDREMAFAHLNSLGAKTKHDVCHLYIVTFGNVRSGASTS